MVIQEPTVADLVAGLAVFIRKHLKALVLSGVAGALVSYGIIFFYYEYEPNYECEATIITSLRTQTELFGGLPSWLGLSIGMGTNPILQVEELALSEAVVRRALLSQLPSLDSPLYVHLCRLMLKDKCPQSLPTEGRLLEPLLNILIPSVKDAISVSSDPKKGIATITLSLSDEKLSHALCTAVPAQVKAIMEEVALAEVEIQARAIAHALDTLSSLLEKKQEEYATWLEQARFTIKYADQIERIKRQQEIENALLVYSQLLRTILLEPLALGTQMAPIHIIYTRPLPIRKELSLPVKVAITGAGALLFACTTLALIWFVEQVRHSLRRYQSQH